MARSRAYRRWKTVTKYISRLKERYFYWHVEDASAPRGNRKAKNWKEIEDVKEAKMYKKTTTKYTFGWDKVDDHKRIKGYREKGKEIINNDLKDIQNGDLPSILPNI